MVSTGAGTDNFLRSDARRRRRRDDRRRSQRRHGIGGRQPDGTPVVGGRRRQEAFRRGGCGRQDDVTARPEIAQRRHGIGVSRAHRQDGNGHRTRSGAHPALRESRQRYTDSTF